MRAVHFVHSFSKQSETFVYNYVIALKEQDVDVSVLTLNHLNQKERPFEAVETVELSPFNAKRIWNIGRDIVLGRDRETSAWPEYRKKIERKLDIQKPEVLHAHFGPMGVLLEPIARKLNIPLIVTFYGYDISELTDKLQWQKAYRRLAETARGITVLSEDMKTRAVNVGFDQRQIKIIHLGIDPDEITYQPSSYPVKKFVSVGRLSEKKGHLDTLKAFKDVLNETEKRLQLTIIGEGSERKKLEGYINSNDLQGKVVLAGRMPHSDVIKYMGESDAFILNSKTASAGDMEGTPTVLAEAQAAGLPCITTFHSGIPEMIPAENHRFLAEEGKVSQISANIQKLLTLNKEELNEVHQLGRKKVEEAFDVRGEAAKFKILYQQIV